MKKLLYLVFLITLTGSLNAQTTAWISQVNEEENFVAAGATKYFTVSKTPIANSVYAVRSFNSNGTELMANSIIPNSSYTNMTVVKILATPTDELYIIGNISNFTTFHSVIFKLNSDLSIAWRREITNGVKTYAKDVIIKGSNVLILSSFYPTATGGTRMAFTEFNTANGNFNQTIQPTFDFAPRQMVIGGNQNVYVCGGSEINLNQARVVRFGTGFFQVWNFTTNLAANTSTLTPFEFIQLDAYGNVYVGGNSYNSTYGVFRNEVRKLNSSGVQVSSYQSTNINSDEIMKGMKLNIAGQLFYVSKMQSTGSTNSNHRIVKLTSSTPLTFQNSFATTGMWPTSGVTVTGFEVTQGGAVFMSGKRNGGSNLTNNYLSFKLKSNFTFDFFEQYNGGACNSLIKAIPGSFPNDEFVTTGVIGNINMLIKYTVVAPKITPDSEPSPVGEIAKLTCYPNPVNSTLTIEGITDLNAMKLVDISGKQYAIQTIDAAFDGTTYNLKIDVAHLAKGIYILSAVNNGKMENLKVVVDH
jgi:hypothetical protein